MGYILLTAIISVALGAAIVLLITRRSFVRQSEEIRGGREALARARREAQETQQRLRETLVRIEAEQQAAQSAAHLGADRRREGWDDPAVVSRSLDDDEVGT